MCCVLLTTKTKQIFYNPLNKLGLSTATLHNLFKKIGIDTETRTLNKAPVISNAVTVCQNIVGFKSLLVYPL